MKNEKNKESLKSIIDYMANSLSQFDRHIQKVPYRRGLGPIDEVMLTRLAFLKKESLLKYGWRLNENAYSFGDNQHKPSYQLFDIKQINFEYLGTEQDKLLRLMGCNNVILEQTTGTKEVRISGSETKQTWWRPDIILEEKNSNSISKIKWVIETKVLRPVGDNNKIEDHWNSKIYYHFPKPFKKSAVSDAFSLKKYKKTGFEIKGTTYHAKNYAIVLYVTIPDGATKLTINKYLSHFEYLCNMNLEIKLGRRVISAKQEIKEHPHLRQFYVVGWVVRG